MAPQVEPEAKTKTIVKAADPVADEGDVTLTELVTTLPDGSIAVLRPGLKRLVQRGAQHFIGLVDVRPSFRMRRFFGWRVLAYRGPGELLSGDVVIRVNGKSIERPDQFIAVWNALANHDVFVLEMIRGGRPVTRRYPIVEGPL